MRCPANQRLGDNGPDTELDRLLEATLIRIEIGKVAFELCWDGVIRDIKNHLATVELAGIERSPEDGGGKVHDGSGGCIASTEGVD